MQTETEAPLKHQALLVSGDLCLAIAEVPDPPPAIIRYVNGRTYRIVPPPSPPPQQKIIYEEICE